VIHRRFQLGSNLGTKSIDVHPLHIYPLESGHSVVERSGRLFISIYLFFILRCCVCPICAVQHGDHHSFSAARLASRCDVSGMTGCLMHILLIESPTASVFVLALSGYLSYLLLLRPFYFSRLLNWPGPPRTSLLLGNMIDMSRSDQSLYLRWLTNYGSVVRFGFLFGVRFIFLFLTWMGF
jgi:hypothetical protein